LDVERVSVSPFEAVNASLPTVADVAESLTVHEVAAGEVVKKSGSPRLNPDVLSVPTMAVPAVVVMVKPVPAYVVAMLALIVCCPLLLVESAKLTLLEFTNANRPTVAEVALSLTVQLELVTVGTV
jgi:hypothetical protein